MSKFHLILPAIPQRSSSPIKKTEPLADTTVAINLRFFEDESKTQAEREYDAHYGRLPDPPVGVVDGKQRTIHKKRRKVRSAIVSRRKSALYEKKLEEELAFRDSVNKRLRDKLVRHKGTLEEIKNKIDVLERDFKGKSGGSAQDTPAEFRDGTPSRDGSSRVVPGNDSPVRRTPFPSAAWVYRQAVKTPQSQQSLRVPSIHEPGDCSQITNSVGRSP